MHEVCAHDINITFTGHSRSQPSILSAFLSGFVLISRVAYIWRGLWGGPDPWTGLASYAHASYNAKESEKLVV